MHCDTADHTTVCPFQFSDWDPEESASCLRRRGEVYDEVQLNSAVVMECRDSNESIGAEHDKNEWIDSIVAGCQNGERDAQHQLYDRYRDRVFRTVLRMVGGSDADDLAQRVFLQVFRRIGHFVGTSGFTTWLHRLVINECLQHMRSQRRRRTQPLDSSVPVLSRDAIAKFEQSDLIEKSIARLDPELRAVFVLREVDELSYGEIALAMGLPEGTVASRMSRARQRLKEILMQLGWEPGDP